MSWSVNQVENVFTSLGPCVVRCPIVILHLNGVALDGDTALTFKVHVVKHLPFGHLNGLGELKQTVGQR